MMVRYCFIIFLLAGFAGAEEHTIRGTSWGMTKDEVRSAEKWKCVWDKGDYIKFVGELKPGEETRLYYKFHDGALVRIQYEFEEDLETFRKEIFRYFLPILSRKYGDSYERRSEQKSKNMRYAAARFGLPANDWFYYRWKIHGEGTDKQTHLELSYSDAIGVKIVYESLVYRRGIEQLEKDKERDAKYSLTNSDDL